MRVVPIGAVLLNRELISERRSWSDSGKSIEAGDAVHLTWQDQTMPMDRRGLVRVVAYMNDDIFAFHKAEQRPRNLLVDHHAVCGATSDADLRVVDDKVVFLAECRRVRHSEKGDWA